MESIFGTGDPNVDKATGQREPDEATLLQLKNGASWFYWIAGLSLVNSVIFAFGSGVSFITGLAITSFVDTISDSAVQQGAAGAFRYVGFVLNLVVVAGFALVGFWANKAVNSVFIVGMMVYALDGIAWLLFDGYFAFAFHVFALIMIFRGFMASREVHRVRAHNLEIEKMSAGDQLKS